jgi:hypothetical protein
LAPGFCNYRGRVVTIWWSQEELITGFNGIILRFDSFFPHPMHHHPATTVA